MTGEKMLGTTAGGKPISEELVDQLAGKADAGYDIDETLRSRGGRPPIGAAAASVESVWLDPELREAIAQRAKRDQEAPSAVVRKALRAYLRVGSTADSNDARGHHPARTSREHSRPCLAHECNATPGSDRAPR